MLEQSRTSTIRAIIARSTPLRLPPGKSGKGVTGDGDERVAGSVDEGAPGRGHEGVSTGGVEGDEANGNGDSARRVDPVLGREETCGVVTTGIAGGLRPSVGVAAFGGAFGTRWGDGASLSMASGCCGEKEVGLSRASFGDEAWLMSSGTGRLNASAIAAVI